MPGKSPFVSSSSIDNPPFALDYKPTVSPDRTTQLTKLNRWGEQGFPLEGGQKEARLRRVAILKTAKEVDHLFSIKIENINVEVTTPEKLYNEFRRFGPIGDVYIPKKLNTEHPRFFSIAYVRFFEKAHADAALEYLQEKSVVVDRKLLTASTPVKPQPGFGRVPSFRVITCDVPDEPKKHVGFEQCITLEQCMARNGAPWTSKSDLKRLEPHASLQVYDCFGVRIDNLHTAVTADDLRRFEFVFSFIFLNLLVLVYYHFIFLTFSEFSRFGSISHVYCPKPLQVVLWNNNPNDGKAFVRFHDRKAADDAFREMDGVELNGQR